jgi:hypothetical protein
MSRRQIEKRQEPDHQKTWSTWRLQEPVWERGARPVLDLPWFAVEKPFASDPLILEIPNVVGARSVQQQRR